MELYKRPELWGGIECSLWRLYDQYLNQLEIANREQYALRDLEKFAKLGVKKLRYPVLVESYTNYDAALRWQNTRAILNEMHSLGIAPIIEILHHGCGPRNATFLTDHFADNVQRFASEVAVRFPAIEFYCPVNEPLTTARFSGLYGFWYPHHKNRKTFARIFIAQMLATILSIRAVREINPEAKFIQMEDLCKTYSTPVLQYQADFENERRWLTFDIVTSRVLPGHPMWKYLLSCGIKESELHFIAEKAVAPDVLGLNYYVTSERFLDDRVEDYSGLPKGGNGKHEYVDVEAIRVRLNQPSGLQMLARECWDRYSIPIAFSEIHLNGTNDDQIRWFNEAWETAIKMISDGIPVEGICAWALTGSHGWDKLLTQVPGTFERGVFDIRNRQLIDTPYSRFIKDLFEKGESQHPSLAQRGWWRSADRFLKKPVYM
jgi:dTDP-4-dehydrorhamnose reductase